MLRERLEEVQEQNRARHNQTEARSEDRHAELVRELVTVRAENQALRSEAHTAQATANAARAASERNSITIREGFLRLQRNFDETRSFITQVVQAVPQAETGTTPQPGPPARPVQSGASRNLKRQRDSREGPTLAVVPEGGGSGEDQDEAGSEVSREGGSPMASRVDNATWFAQVDAFVEENCNQTLHRAGWDRDDHQDDDHGFEGSIRAGSGSGAALGAAFGF